MNVKGKMKPKPEQLINFDLNPLDLTLIQVLCNMFNVVNGTTFILKKAEFNKKKKSKCRQRPHRQ